MQVRPIRVYVASTLSNYVRVREIMSVLSNNDIIITYDWTGHAKILRDYLDQGDLSYSTSACDKVPKPDPSIAEGELNGVITSDVLLVVQPAGRGTYCEFGAALALKKPIVVLGTHADIDGDSRPVSFHHLPCVRYTTDVQEAIRLIKSF